MTVPSRFSLNLFVSLLFLIAVVAFCYAFVDRPLSLYLESQHFTYHPGLRFFEHFPVVTTHGAVLILITIPWLGKKVRSRFAVQVLIRMAVSVALAEFIKTIFKGYFGRYWTRTWIFDNPSLNGTNHYGFNWFQSGPWFRSFPSGHACVITAAATALALCFPNNRGVRTTCTLVVVCTASAVLAQNFHFLSDLIAGTWLGFATAMAVAKMWPWRRLNQERTAELCLAEDTTA